MNRYFILLIFITTFIFFQISGEENSEHLILFSSGYSLLHNYDNGNHSGMNFKLGFEPELTESVHVDVSISLNIFWKEDSSYPLFRSNYSMCHVPSISLGPRYSFSFKKIKPFIGGGINMSVAINHDSSKNETSASFGPGIYAKTGVDYKLSRKFFIGIESDYKWCFTVVPHIVSFNLRFGYIY